MSLMRRGAQWILVAICLGLASPNIAQPGEQLSVGQAKIDVVFLSDPPEPLRTMVLDWISAAARAVATYYERFPVAQLEIRVSLYEGSGIEGGQVPGWNNGLITIGVGLSSTAIHFARDWIMTHEMVHLAFPTVSDRHHWMEEGLATYVEPIARARAGELSAKHIWAEMVRDMPQGLPLAGDSGLDFTRTWASTYWGGALFCLLADVEIRKRTGNTKGLEHALRAIRKQCGTVDTNYDLASAFEIGDRAVGVPVLQELYDKMKATPMPVDLDQLWKDLGVERRAGDVSFDDTAPLASIRKAITQSVDRSKN